MWGILRRRSPRRDIGERENLSILSCHDDLIHLNKTEKRARSRWYYMSYIIIYCIILYLSKYKNFYLDKGVKHA